MSLPKLNPIEPPWYGPVCPVVWEGWHREVSPYPDQSADSSPGTRFAADSPLEGAVNCELVSEMKLPPGKK
jgi:hypothetical protein